MAFNPDVPLTLADVQAMNNAAKNFGSTTANNFKLAQETDSRPSDVARWFRTGSSSRNIVTRDYVGKTIGEIARTAGRAESIRLVVAATLAGGVSGNMEAGEFAKTEKLTLSSVTDAAIVARSYLVGGTKTFFMKHRAAETQVVMVDGAPTLLTTYNPLAPGEYKVGMFDDPIDPEPLDEDPEEEDDPEEEEWDS